MWKIRLNKYGSQWYWFTTNPEGGGFGSHCSGSMRAVLVSAQRGMPPGTEYELMVNDNSPTKEKTPAE